jgi:predicted MFS family arabinose efflux permease
VLSSAGAGEAYFPTVFVAFFLMGLGAGTAFMPLLTIALADVPPSDAGVASGLINVSLYISAALGLAALGAIATDRTQSLADQGWAADHALVAGYQLAFVIAAVCLVACVAVAMVVLNAARRAPATA